MVGPMLPPGWGFGGGVRMPTCVAPAFRKHGVATAREPASPPGHHPLLPPLLSPAAPLARGGGGA